MMETPDTAAQAVDINGTFDIHECAKFLKIDKETVSRKAKVGEIPGAKIGRAWVFLVSDIIEYAQEEVRKQTRVRKDKADKKKPSEPQNAMKTATIVPVSPSGRSRRQKNKRPDLSGFPDLSRLPHLLSQTTGA